MKSLHPTILAIESSCDETSAAVISGGRIESNIVASQADLHAKFGGVVPEVAAREHIPAMIPAIKLALKDAGRKLSDVTHIAVTYGPGLATSLMVGVDTARALSSATNLPLIPVNHLEAHIYAGFAENKIRFPALVLVVSGGHTMIVLMSGHGRLKIVGQTLDDAAGEAFDKTAKLLGLGYPGGPKISALAEQGRKDAFAFPRPLLKAANYDFSFSGLKTAVLYEAQKHRRLTPTLKADFAASLQAAIIETLIGKLSKAIDEFRPKTVLLGGGVAANRMLRLEFLKLAQAKKIAAAIPKIEHCTDNAAMIGLAAYYRLKSGKAEAKAFRSEPSLSL
ncbi:MAG: tRNA (adenosine(37)-N6)-threonylcarbamoyltransferase complex transferase subunit TsaD [Candidatus Saccharibacteria bacterium]